MATVIVKAAGKKRTLEPPGMAHTSGHSSSNKSCASCAPGGRCVVGGGGQMETCDRFSRHRRGGRSLTLFTQTTAYII